MATEPELLVRVGWTRNPLAWAYRLGQSLSAGFLLAVLLATLTRAMPRTSEADELRLIACLAAGGVTALTYLWFKTRVPRGTISFGSGRMVSTVTPPGETRTERTVPYRDLRHLELVGHEVIRLRFLDGNREGDAIEIPLPRHQIEDVFDILEEMLRADDAGLLFSSFQERHIEYSRDWALEEVFPWSKPVKMVVLGFPGSMADKTRLAASWTAEGIRVSPTVGRETPLVVDRERVLGAGGFVAGTIDYSGGGFEVLFGTGDVVTVSPARAVSWNEVRGAITHPPNKEARLSLSAPMPGTLALATIAAYRFGLGSKRIQTGIIRG